MEAFRSDKYMEKVLIVGAGGFGRELLAWCRQHPEHGCKWTVVGFLDDTTNTVAGDVRVVGRIADYVPQGEKILLGLGMPATKHKVVEQLRLKRAVFHEFIHPSAIIGERVSLGIGTIVCPGAVLTSDVKLGEFVTINICASVGHDAVVGDYSTLSGHCDVTGHAKVGNRVFMGSHAVITPKCVVGDDAVIGAGAVVFSTVRPGTTMIGNPSRQLLGI